MSHDGSARRAPRRGAHRKAGFRVLLAAVAASACGSGEAPSAAGSSSVPSPQVIASTPASAKPTAPWGPAPASARRDSAPPGTADRILAEGAAAPPFVLQSGESARLSLDEALTKTKYVILVFYRGAW